MHAVLVKLTIDPAQARPPPRRLRRKSIRSAPGFVAAYWLEPIDRHGFSSVVFESEEEARRAVPPESNWAAPGVSVEDIEIRRVAVSA
jgi:hypothetical protein